jgi:hypothetical protein
MLEYGNNQFVAHYKLLSGVGIEGWDEYESKEMIDAQFSINRMSESTPLTAVQLLKNEPDFIVKTPFQKIQGLINEIFKGPVCDRVYRSDIDNGILVVHIKKDIHVEKETVKKSLRDNLIWEDLLCFDTHEVHLHFEHSKKTNVA